LLLNETSLVYFAGINSVCSCWFWGSFCVYWYVLFKRCAMLARLWLLTAAFNFDCLKHQLTEFTSYVSSSVSLTNICRFWFLTQLVQLVV